jgi:hypothetical protein
MSGVVHTATGCFNIASGKLKSWGGRLWCLEPLESLGRQQAECGWVQLAWQRENTAHKRSVGTAKDKMMRKLNGRD